MSSSPSAAAAGTGTQSPLSDAAKSIINTASEYKVVQYAIDTVKPVIPDVVSSNAEKYSTITLDYADESIVNALNKLNLLRDKQSLVQQQWYIQVDDIIRSHPSIQSGVDSLNNIITKLNDTYINLLQQGKSFDQTEFIDSFKSRLGTVYNDSLYTPAQQFYQQIKSLATDDSTHNASTSSNSPRTTQRLLDSARGALGKDWEDKIIDSVNSVRANATAVYNTAFTTFMQLKSDTTHRADQASASASEFVSQVRDRLGLLYSDKLEQPLIEFYNRASSVAVPELNKMYESIDYDHNNEISMLDLVNTSRAVVQWANHTVAMKWNGVLHTTQNTVDKVLPPVDNTNSNGSSTTDESYSVRGVASHVTQRVKDHVNDRVNTVQSVVTDQAKTRYTQIRDISTNTVASKTGVDPVAIVESIYNKLFGKLTDVQHTTHATVDQLKSALEQLQLQLQQRLELIRDQAVTTTKLDQLQPTLQNVKSNASNVVSTQANKLGITQRISILQSKVSDTLDALRSLGNESSTFVLNRQLTKLPADVFYFLTHSPALLLAFFYSQDRVKSTNTTSNNTNDMTVTSDDELEQLIDKVEAVLVALKHLFLLTPSVQQAQSTNKSNDSQLKHVTNKTVHHTLPKQGATIYTSSRANPTSAASPVSSPTPTPADDTTTSSTTTNTTTTTDHVVNKQQAKKHNKKQNGAH